MLIPAGNQQVGVVWALSQRRGELLTGQIRNRLCAHINPVAIRVEAHVCCDVLGKVDAVACLTRDGKHFMGVYRDDLVLVLRGISVYMVVSLPGVAGEGEGCAVGLRPGVGLMGPNRG